MENLSEIGPREIIYETEEAAYVREGDQLHPHINLS